MCVCVTGFILLVKSTDIFILTVHNVCVDCWFGLKLQNEKDLITVVRARNNNPPTDGNIDTKYEIRNTKSGTRSDESVIDSLTIFCLLHYHINEESESGNE